MNPIYVACIHTKRVGQCAFEYISDQLYTYDVHDFLPKGCAGRVRMRSKRPSSSMTSRCKFRAFSIFEGPGSMPARM